MRMRRLFSGRHCADELLGECAALIRARASQRSRGISSVTWRLGPKVEAEKKPAITAVEAGRDGRSLTGKFGAHWPELTTPKWVATPVRSQRWRPKMRTTIPG